MQTLSPAAPAVNPAFTLPADLATVRALPAWIALFGDDEPEVDADQGDDEPDNYGLFDGSEW